MRERSGGRKGCGKNAMTGVVQWVGPHPASGKVAGSMPGQGICLGFGPGAQLGACKRQLIDVSLEH